MGQPDTVNQLPDRARLLKPKFDDVEKLLVELMIPSFWDITPTNEVKGITFNLFRNKNVIHIC